MFHDGLCGGNGETQKSKTKFVQSDGIRCSWYFRYITGDLFWKEYADYDRETMFGILESIKWIERAITF